MLEDQFSQADHHDRPVKQAMLRGLAGRCPACGEGAMFTSYLKVSPTCDSCGEELHHQRADDGPAYLTVTIVCHIVGIFMPLLFLWTELSPAMIGLVLTAGTVPATLLLLPRAKGFWIAIQWAKRMHGFGASAATPA